MSCPDRPELERSAIEMEYTPDFASIFPQNRTTATSLDNQTSASYNSSSGWRNQIAHQNVNPTRYSDYTPPQQLGINLPSPYTAQQPQQQPPPPQQPQQQPPPLQQPQLQPAQQQQPQLQLQQQQQLHPAQQQQPQLQLQQQQQLHPAQQQRPLLQQQQQRLHQTISHISTLQQQQSNNDQNLLQGHSRPGSAAAGLTQTNPTSYTSIASSSPSYSMPTTSQANQQQSPIVHAHVAPYVDALASVSQTAQSPIPRQMAPTCTPPTSVYFNPLQSYECINNYYMTPSQIQDRAQAGQHQQPPNLQQLLLQAPQQQHMQIQPRQNRLQSPQQLIFAQRPHLAQQTLQQQPQQYQSQQQHQQFIRAPVNVPIRTLESVVNHHQQSQAGFQQQVRPVQQINNANPNNAIQTPQVRAPQRNTVPHRQINPRRQTCAMRYSYSQPNVPQPPVQTITSSPCETTIEQTIAGVRSVEQIVSITGPPAMNNPSVSVSSTTRPPSVSKMQSVEIQATAESFNKACQFDSRFNTMVSKSLNATVEMASAECQTESVCEKNFVDRACSPIRFSTGIRMKTTAKRRKVEVERDNSSDTEEINVIE